MSTKDAYYFSHDSNARNDHRIIKLRMKYGAKGHGIYFMIIEILRDAVDYSISMDNLQAIAYDIRESKEIIEDIINNYNLFKIENDFFYSNSLKRRMTAFDEKKKKRSNAGKKGMKNRWESSLQKDNNVITPLYQKNNSVITVKDSKEEKIKVNKKENVKRKKFIKPKLSEVESYFKYLGSTQPEEISNRFNNYYESNGWMVGRNKMVSWKHTASNWLTEEKKKEKVPFVDESKIEYDKKKARRDRDRYEEIEKNAVSDDEKSKILGMTDFGWK